jgi:hypothetical protein
MDNVWLSGTVDTLPLYFFPHRKKLRNLATMHQSTPEPVVTLKSMIKGKAAGNVTA